METTNTNPENQISENQEQKEDDKKDKTLLIKKVLFITHLIFYYSTEFCSEQYNKRNCSRQGESAYCWSYSNG